MRNHDVKGSFFTGLRRKEVSSSGAIRGESSAEGQAEGESAAEGDAYMCNGTVFLSDVYPITEADCDSSIINNCAQVRLMDIFSTSIDFILSVPRSIITRRELRSSDNFLVSSKRKRSERRW